MRLLAALLAALLAVAAPAAGQAIDSTGGSFARLELLPGRAQADGTRLAGLRIALAPGWKTYWRSPGEAGIPPDFDWTGSTNLARVEVLWPRPVRFESFGLSALGYAGEVVLPLRLSPEDPAAPIALALEARLGVCSDICVVEVASLDRRLAPRTEGGAEAVAGALAAVPPPAAEAGLAVACRLTGAGAERRLSATLTPPHPLTEPDLLLEGPPGSWFEDVEIAASGRGIAATATLIAPDTPWIARDAIRMTLLGADGFAADIRGCTGG
jgi:DsbC/DsbD-like thiol-disulfide interchange protein